MESNHLELGEKAEKKEVKSIGKYENIKADYFLQKVFDNLEKKRILNMVKYNKNLMKRINIAFFSFLDYKIQFAQYICF